MNPLRISLLGALEATVNGTLIELESNYVRALLYFLTIEKHCPHRREVLAEMFWPEKPEGAARNSLKQALSNLRKALGDRDNSEPFILVSRCEIQFNQSSHYCIDATEFTRLIEAVEEHAHDDFLTCKACENHLSRAVRLYQGDFLADFYLPDNRYFNDWIMLKREVFQREMANALGKLAQIHEARGAVASASEYCYQLAELEPWNEENHRNLMRLLALNGMRSAALRQYQICCESLQNELEVAPSDATIVLYEEIKSWEPGAFPNGDPPSIPVGNSGLATDSEPDAISKSLYLRKLIFRHLLGFILVGLIFWTGSTYWAGFSNLQTTTIDPNTQDGSQTIHSTAAETGMSSPKSVDPEENEIVLATQPSPGESSTPGLTLMPSTLLANSGASERDLQALKILYEQTGGSNWVRSDGWLSDRSPCEWYGVTCRGEKIVKLDLASNQLNGAIPAEISQLRYLEHLDLMDNELSGSIPPELGDLTELTHLILLGNSELSGPVPPELGQMSNLVQLELASDTVGSLLSGPIPAEFGDLLNLEVFIIHSSLIRGPIPVELFNLKKLKVLHLGNNQLSGSIDQEFGSLIYLESLDLGGNAYMSGPIPPELGNLIRLQHLWLGDSNLSGTLPPEIGKLTRLRILQVNGNPLSGPLPDTLMNLNSQEFWFDRTNLCEPADEAFQTWLEDIYDVKRTGVVCAPEGN